MIALVSAVAFPQIVHIIGAALGMSALLGEILLPMHLPIILMGLLVGHYAAYTAGLLSPLVSFALTGMPSSSLLAFMMMELCVYEIFAGLLRSALHNCLNSLIWEYETN